MFLKNLSYGLFMFSKSLMQLIHDLFIDVAFMRTESACKCSRNVEKLVYNGFLPFLLSQPIIAFGDHFDHIGCWKIESFLPDFPESVNSCNCSSRCGSLASETEHELWNNVKEF